MKSVAQRHVRISHFILWITMSAAYIVVFREFNPSLSEIVTILFESILTGLAWTGTVVVAYRLFTGKGLIEPGSWLVFCLGIVFLLDAITSLWPKDFLVVPEPVAQALLCLVFSLPTLSKRLDSFWKGFFVLLVILKVCFLTLVLVKSRVVDFSWPNLIVQCDYFWLAIGGLGPPLISSWKWKEKSKLSWLHWLGVVFFTAWCLINLGWKISN